MKRHKHSLSHYRLLTGNVGDLLPIGLIEALPGDTFQQSTSLLIRVTPQLAPVMHPVSVRVHHWFIPNRLVYDDWEDFITGGEDGNGPTNPYPTNSGSITTTGGELTDFLGLPSATYAAGALSLLPIRAYNKVYNGDDRDWETK